jgi:hypothetical protein
MQSLLRSPRTLAVWALLGVAGLSLFFTFLDWVSASSFTHGSAASVGQFANPVVLGMAVVAVLLASKVAPALGNVRRVAMIALSELVAGVFFGLISWLVGLGTLGDLDGIGVLKYLFLGLASIALVAVGGLIVYGFYSEAGGKLNWVSDSKPPAA